MTTLPPRALLMFAAPILALLALAIALFNGSRTLFWTVVVIAITLNLALAAINILQRPRQTQACQVAPSWHPEA